jgi:hypothetical protein
VLRKDFLKVAGSVYAKDMSCEQPIWLQKLG